MNLLVQLLLELFCSLASDCYLGCDDEVDDCNASGDDDDDDDDDEACLSKEVGSIQLREMNIFFPSPQRWSYESNNNNNNMSSLQCSPALQQKQNIHHVPPQK